MDVFQAKTAILAVTALITPRRSMVGKFDVVPVEQCLERLCDRKQFTRTFTL
jgi:hypothetical protein